MGNSLECPNPNCPPEPSTFKAYLDWKSREELDIPGFMPVRLVCSHCGHQVKAWVINSEIQKLYKEVKLQNEAIMKLTSILKEIVPKGKRGLFDKILEVFESG